MSPIAAGSIVKLAGPRSSPLVVIVPKVGVADVLTSCAIAIEISLLLTVVVTPVPPENVSVSPVLKVSFEPESAAKVKLVERAAVETAVTRPFPFTVTTGIAVLEPKLPTLLFTVASVKDADTLPVPSKEENVAEPSPESTRFLAVANAVAVAEVPEYPLEVIVPRLTPPSANVIVPPSASIVMFPPESRVRFPPSVIEEPLIVISSTVKEVRAPKLVIFG